MFGKLMPVAFVTGSTKVNILRLLKMSVGVVAFKPPFAMTMSL